MFTIKRVTETLGFTKFLGFFALILFCRIVIIVDTLCKNIYLMYGDILLWHGDNLNYGKLYKNSS